MILPEALPVRLQHMGFRDFSVRDAAQRYQFTQAPGTWVEFILSCSSSAQAYAISWSTYCPVDQRTQELRVMLGAFPGCDRVTVDVKSTDDTLLARVTIRPHHLAALCEQDRLAPWVGRLTVTLQRAAREEPGYIVMNLLACADGEDTARTTDARFAATEDELDFEINRDRPADQVPIAIPLLLPQSADSLQSNWPLFEHIVLTGELGEEYGLLGPFASEAEALCAGQALDPVTRWRAGKFLNPLRASLLIG